ncbi:cation:dicarboxylase symporter family transporter [Duganella sp. FT92W]|uniref:Cation:dicarboxylase symporter family transporter n=1 Tax=Pseudoduganella rivuli TaxID=2666085 RepID=A0A7X2IT26_9BURK|nr:dicarboxylate/amino acid:cation symporter [Pseudoduganella rivuli]MRV75262.1 cation:dicarboxylase symporter family transporter [Pseudoduganella rivuli]
MRNIKLTTWIMAGMVLGVAVGALCHAQAPDPAAAKEIAAYFSLLTDIFLRLIKMIIAPLVFATLVSGIASMNDGATLGRVGVKAFGWFVTASFISLFLGLLFSNLFQPGQMLGLALPDSGAATKLATGSFSLKDFITHLVPRSFAEAMANNEILQILVFSLFFGVAAAAARRGGALNVVNLCDELVHIMLTVTGYVMRFAPVGVFAALAAAITVQGFGVLTTYGKLLGSFVLALATLWAVLIGAGALFLGPRVFTLLKLLREPIMLGFSTASSESAYPKLLTQLEKFGVNNKIAGFVLPLGYSFNLDGSMLYQAFAALFIAQAYHIDMSLTQQLTMLLVLMVSSKGMAGVPRGSLVVVAAVLPMFGLPEAGLLLIMGVDQLFDMARTGTNVLGNGIATAVVAKWEGAGASHATPLHGERAAA